MQTLRAYLGAVGARASGVSALQELQMADGEVPHESEAVMSARAVVVVGIAIAVTGFVLGVYFNANLPQCISIACLPTAMWFTTATIFQLGVKS